MELRIQIYIISRSKICTFLLKNKLCFSPSVPSPPFAESYFYLQNVTNNKLASGSQSLGWETWCTIQHLENLQDFQGMFLWWHSHDATLCVPSCSVTYRHTRCSGLHCVSAVRNINCIWVHSSTLWDIQWFWAEHLVFGMSLNHSRKINVFTELPKLCSFLCSSMTAELKHPSGVAVSSSSVMFGHGLTVRGIVYSVYSTVPYIYIWQKALNCTATPPKKTVQRKPIRTNINPKCFCLFSLKLFSLCY